MDQELIAYLDKRFGEVNEQFEKADKRMDGLEAAVRANEVAVRANEAAIRANEVAIRGNGVEIEGLRGQIQQVSEGVAMANQRIDAFEVKVSEKFDEMGKLFDKSHSNLHRRVGSLEAWKEKVERRT